MILQTVPIRVLANTYLSVQTPQLPNQFDWELLLKALGFVVAFAVALVQVRSLSLSSRASLKTDLEILKLLKELSPDDPQYQSAKTTIDDRLARFFGRRRASLAPENWAVILVGTLAAVGFSYWTFVLVKPGFTWWAILTGYFALVGVGAIFQGALLRGIFRSRT